jgi:hypothetical protein
VQTDFAAGPLFGGIDHAGIEGAGIDVEANRALVEFAGIEDAVYGRERVNGAGLRDIHLNNLSGMNDAFAGGNVLTHHMEILYL